MPIEGFCRVPEAPGLGVDIDENKLKQAAERAHIPKLDTIGVLQLPNGQKYYTRGEPKVETLTGFEEGAIRGINYERLANDGSPEYERLDKQLKEKGPFIE